MPTKYRVQITQNAQRDIREILDYISQDSIANARRFIQRLKKQLATLETFPSRCSFIPEDSDKIYRQMTYGKYRSIFRIKGREVMVVRVIHGARLLEMQHL